jgi:hypothetical protein
MAFGFHHLLLAGATATMACHRRIELFSELVLKPNSPGIGQPGIVHDLRLVFTCNFETARIPENP